MVWERIDITTESGETVRAQAPVIVSASRATDIPAFYADWFFDRLEKGHSAWTNPFNGVKSYVSYARTRLIVFWSKNPRPLLPHLEKLREKGIRTYVLSNNNPASMEYIRQMFTADGKTMEDYFDAVYLSYELHELKPSEAIFRKMIAAGGMRPEETLFIDDGQKNVEAARKLGFSVYMPAPGEDFGHIFENLNRYEENL